MLGQISSIRFIWGLFRISFVSLPYLSFVAWPGLVTTLGLLWLKFRRSALDLTTRNLVLLIAALLWLSSLFAANRGEAFLQLFNFYPYLLLFAVLPHLLKGAEPLAQLATDLVIATIPINLAAVVEYLLRAPGIPAWLKRTELKAPSTRRVRRSLEAHSRGSRTRRRPPSHREAPGPCRPASGTFPQRWTPDAGCPARCRLR